MSRRARLRRAERRAPHRMDDAAWLTIFRWLAHLDPSGWFLEEVKESLGAPRHLRAWRPGGGEDDYEHQTGSPPDTEQP